MSKRNGRLTQNDLERLDREGREVTRHGFDGGAYGAWLDAAAQVGVDPDLLASQLAARAVRAALASHEEHKQRTAGLNRGLSGEQRRRLRRRLDQVGAEQGGRSSVVLVRKLHEDPTRRSIRAFLETRAPVVRLRPAMAARARRPRRSSSSSRSSGVDPGAGDGGPEQPGDPSRPALVGYLRHPTYGLVNRALAAFLRRAGR